MRGNQQLYSSPRPTGQYGNSYAPRGGYPQQRGGYNAPPSGRYNAPPQRGRGKKRKSGKDTAQRVVFYLALLTALCSGGYLLYNLVVLPYMVESGFNEFRDAHETQVIASASGGHWSGEDIEEVDPDRNEDGTLKSFTSLLELNKDIVGWITVPSTVIDYPVMLYPDDGEYLEEHNEYYYLHRNIYGEHDKNGTIFAYYPCHFGLHELSKNTVLFGHHMKSGIMFQNLLKYDVYTKSSNLEFYKQNPVIRFDSKYDEGQWVIFSVMKCDASNNSKDTFRWIRSDFENDADFSNFISDIRARSLIDTYNCIDVDSSDYLLMLQTCSYEYDEMRTIIVARRLREGETSIDVSGATRASNPVMPGCWGR